MESNYESLFLVVSLLLISYAFHVSLRSGFINLAIGQVAAVSSIAAISMANYMEFSASLFGTPIVVFLVSFLVIVSINGLMLLLSSRFGVNDILLSLVVLYTLISVDVFMTASIQPDINTRVMLVDYFSSDLSAATELNVSNTISVFKKISYSILGGVFLVAWYLDSTTYSHQSLLLQTRKESPVLDGTMPKMSYLRFFGQIMSSVFLAMFVTYSVFVKTPGYYESSSYGDIGFLAVAVSLIMPLKHNSRMIVFWVVAYVLVLFWFPNLFIFDYPILQGKIQVNFGIGFTLIVFALIRKYPQKFSDYWQKFGAIGSYIGKSKVDK